MKYNIIFYFLLIGLLFACHEDQGNYEYSEYEKIKISGVKEEYAVRYQIDTLSIHPVVEPSDPNADMSYLWFSYDGKDTIAHTQFLDTLTTWKPGKSYSYYFQATNKNTNYSVVKLFRFVVTTELSLGWYVIKDDGSNTEVDFYATGNNNQQIPSLIAQVNGDAAKLRGPAGGIFYYSTYKIFSEEENRYVGTPVMMFYSQDGLVALDRNTGKIVQTYENMFMSPPSESYKPVSLYQNYASFIMNNDGNLYTFSNQSANSGQVGLKRRIDKNDTPYKMSKYAYPNYFTNILCFDDLGSSFYVCTDYQHNFINVESAADTEMPVKNNNKEMLYFGMKGFYQSGPYSGYAVFKDKTDPGIKMITKVDIKDRLLSEVSLINDTLVAGVDAAFDAELFTLSQSEIGIYFVANNKVYFRSIAMKGGAESVEFEIPQDETATFIRSIFLDDRGDNKYNYVVLGTSTSAGEYRVRMFSKNTAGHLNPEPELTLPDNGESALGTVRDVMFMFPKVSIFNSTVSW